VIVTLGNRAVHSHRDIPQSDAVQAVKELFHFCYWFARLYARGKKPDAQLAFDEAALPTTSIPKHAATPFKSLQTLPPVPILAMPNRLLAPKPIRTFSPRP
jgi:type I restriction enzyme, R subunit